LSFLRPNDTLPKSSISKGELSLWKTGEEEMNDIQMLSTRNETIPRGWI